MKYGGVSPTNSIIIEMNGKRRDVVNDFSDLV
jgi:hypothetical protein